MERHTKQLPTAAATLEVQFGAASNRFDQINQRFRLIRTLDLLHRTAFLKQVAAELPEDETRLLKTRVQAGVAPVPAAPGTLAGLWHWLSGQEDRLPRRETLVDRLQGGLRIKTRPMTSLVEVQFSARDPRLALAVVSAAVRAAPTAGPEDALVQVNRFNMYFQPSLQALQEDIQDRQKQLGGDVTVRVVQATANPTVNPLTMSRRERKRLTAPRVFGESGERVEVEQALPADPELPVLMEELNGTRLAEMQTRVLAKFPDSATNRQSTAAAAKQQMQLDQLEADYAAVAQAQGQQHPELQGLAARISVLRESGQQRSVGRRKQLLAEAAQLVDQEKRLQRLITEHQRQRLRLSNQVVPHALQSLELSLDINTAGSIRDRLAAARINSAYSTPPIAVLEPPHLLPVTKPRLPVLRMIFYGLVTFALGLVVVVILSGAEERFWYCEELQAATALPVLAIVPALKRGRPAPEDPDYLVLLQELLDNLEAGRSRLPQVLLVTSVVPAEGKSTSALCLAGLLARRMPGVLLIDADLHRPSLDREVSQGQRRATQPGLVHVLSGRARLEQAVEAVAGWPGLDVLCAGPPPPRPAELLHSQAMADLLRQARARYGVIILNTPPILAVGDAVLLARHADATVLVAGYGKTPLRKVARAARLLSLPETHTQGVLVTGVPRRLACGSVQ